MDIVDSLLRVALLGSTWVLWLLLALSVVSIAAMVERWVFFRRNRAGGEALRKALSGALATGDEETVDRVLGAHASVEADALREAWRWRAGGPEAIADALESELAHARKKLERSMTLLGTLGNNAPFVGLLGTVIGIIAAFSELAANSGQVSAGLMAEIGEALVVTGLGLLVALPAVASFNVFQQLITGRIERGDALAQQVIAYMKASDGPGGTR